MDFLAKELTEYVEAHSSEEPAILQELNRQTHLKVLYPRMLSGHFQGRLLAFLSKMLHPQRILEVGTYTGYACICLAEGLTENGKLITLEKEPELADMIRFYVEKAGFGEKVELKIGDAKQLIPTLTDTWDLVFLDADKENYLNYYELILPQVRKGGVILADNVLWSGKVLSPAVSNDKDTLHLQQFNDFVKQDSRVECVLLPVRDGIMMIRKK
ncbi:MAG: O-methyltransferase [Bacteroidia bacterium]